MIIEFYLNNYEDRHSLLSNLVNLNNFVDYAHNYSYHKLRGSLQFIRLRSDRPSQGSGMKSELTLTPPAAGNEWQTSRILTASENNQANLIFLFSLVFGSMELKQLLAGFCCVLEWEVQLVTGSNTRFNKNQRLLDLKCLEVSNLKQYHTTAQIRR